MFWTLEQTYDANRERFIPTEIYEEEKRTGDKVAEFTEADIENCSNYIYSYDCYASMLLTFSQFTDESDALFSSFIRTLQWNWFVNTVFFWPFFLLAFNFLGL